MSKREADHSLDEEEEEDEFGFIDSEDEDAQDSRFSKLGVKRRKHLHSDDDEEVSDEDDAPEDDHGGIDLGLDEFVSRPGTSKDDEEDDTTSIPQARSKSSKSTSTPSLKTLTPAQLAKSQLRARKSGVIYLSRIPPFMKPHTLKSLLSPYGTLGRMFLTPEAPARQKARIKAGGNKKKTFTDGWVEFESKKKAKICAETLNGEIIGGKKGGWYHDDILNVKYLRGFKWNDLMEQVAGEEREREGRLRAEIHRETRERKGFLDNVDRAKVQRTQEEKRARREGKDSALANIEDGALGKSPTGGKQSTMIFRQNTVKQKDATKLMPKTVLSKLF